MAILAKNRRAYYDYLITETFEAGIVLSGQEVKSAKFGGAQLAGAYAKIMGDEAFLINGHIKPYQHAGKQNDYDPEHSRKLLLHKKEIRKIEERIREKRMTLLPLELFTKAGRIKVKLGIGKSKKEFDKRETIKKHEADRKIQRHLRRSVK